MRAQIGYNGDRYSVNGLLIRTWVVRIAYPRNGNVHRPTAYKQYHVCRADGTLLCIGSTLREARALAKVKYNDDKAVR